MADIANTNISTETQTQTDTTQQQPIVNTENNNQIDYSKIESIIDKSTSKKSDGILKSYFEQQGMSEAEIQNAITDYKTNKMNTEANMQANTQAMQQEIESYKSQIKAMEFKNALSLECLNQKIDTKHIEYIQKLINADSCLDNDGKVNSGKVTEKLNELLTAFPVLKPAVEEKTGIVNIGANVDTTQKQNLTQNTNQNTKRWNRFK